MKKLTYLVGNILYRSICLLLVGNFLLCLMGIRPFVVTSGSMEPAIKAGSMSWVHMNEKWETLRKGDVAAFERADGMIVLHRIVEITESGFVTKGDANEKNDPAEIEKKQIKGKVLFSVPFVGKIFLEKDKKKLTVCLTGSVIVLFIILKLQKNGRKYIG